MKNVKKIITVFLAVCGVLFLLLLLWPEDDSDGSAAEAEAVSDSAEEYVSDTEETGSDTEESGSAAEETGSDTEETGSAAEETAAEVSAQSSEDQGSQETSGVGVVSVGTDSKTATIMIFMNGSDLETKGGEASEDISEMLSSGIGKNVNVIIQTMGTKEWQDYGISSKTAQTYKISDGKLKLIRDNLGQLDCTDSATLSEFISFCKNEYPADRYFFLFWDHGGGPVYGFGYDEWQNEGSSLTLDEMAEAFQQNSDVRFDIIGMDCCIMANMETCYALSPFCRYTLLSEDFMSGLGWSYTNWMKHFEKDPGIPTPLLGKYIVDSVIETNENSWFGDSSCLSLFNESGIKTLYNAWMNYAYENEKKLLKNNYSRKYMSRGRGSLLESFFELWDSDESDVTLSDYYISDMLAVVESVDPGSESAAEVKNALKASVAYYGHTSDSNELTGLAVSLPYGDPGFYGQLKSVYTKLGIDKDYIEWLGNFVTGSNNEDFYDFGGFENSWNGWGGVSQDTGSGGENCYSGYCQDPQDDWQYDYNDEIWYMMEDGILYLYDDETETVFYYNEGEDRLYYYDEDDDEWYETE